MVRDCHPLRSLGPRLPPPDLHQDPLREEKHQEPAPAGPMGFGSRCPDPSAPANPFLAGNHGRPHCPSGPRSPPDLGVNPGDVCSPCRDGRATPAVDRRPESRHSLASGFCSQPSPAGGCRAGGPFRRPNLNDVQLEDLKDTGRLLELFRQAVVQGFVTSCEADRLRFVAAAEHARG